MPSGSSARRFAHDVISGKTTVCEALDELFTNAGRHNQPASPFNAHLAWFNTQDALDDIPAAVKSLVGTGPEGVLGAKALKAKDLNHIDRWPRKEEVRAKLAEAIQGNRNVHFLWELHGGDDEITHIDDPDQAGDITITFRSPLGRVRFNPAPPAPDDEVEVQVG